MASKTDTNLESQHRIIPKTLRYRPMPAPYVEGVSTLPIVRKVPTVPVPCRRCLQDSTVGEEMLLVSYDPFLGDSPYRCASPIFVHASCEPAVFPSSGGLLPEQQRTRPLSIRAYDENHMMLSAQNVQGDQLLEVCDRILREEVTSVLGTKATARYCHVHYAQPGCFAVRVERGE
ncbi:hypothetical protein F5Y16DRAFT_414159 [Xylariaceae sp. FL0255]|nr:hypothetical protein F5Y16DRAFT_414159 [Xylariaceae sp. FL0255]